MNCIVSGASSGIGREIVNYLLDNGHKVLAIARRKELLKDISKLSTLTILSVDLGMEESQNVIKAALKEWDRVDVLINNAGQLVNKPFAETSNVDFQEQFTANVLTAVNLIQASDKWLKAGSHIVNISSMGGVQGSSKYSGLSAYSSTKGALTILTECLAEEYKEKKVSVNALALGAVQTKMLETAFPGFDAGVSPVSMAKYISDFALNSASIISGKVISLATGNP